MASSLATVGSLIVSSRSAVAFDHFQTRSVCSFCRVRRTMGEALPTHRPSDGQAICIVRPAVTGRYRVRCASAAAHVPHPTAQARRGPWRRYPTTPGSRCARPDADSRGSIWPINASPHPPARRLIYRPRPLMYGLA